MNKPLPAQLRLPEASVDPSLQCYFAKDEETIRLNLKLQSLSGCTSSPQYYYLRCPSGLYRSRGTAGRNLSFESSSRGRLLKPLGLLRLDPSGYRWLYGQQFESHRRQLTCLRDERGRWTGSF